MIERSVVLAGNIADGITVYGPFETADDATEWAESQLDDTEWLITKLLRVL